jgi:hypothetical protein
MARAIFDCILFFLCYTGLKLLKAEVDIVMRKIAIIKLRDIFYNYGDDSQKVIDSITEWEEVSEEDYALLKDAAGQMNFTVLEQPTYSAFRDILAKNIDKGHLGC